MPGKFFAGADVGGTSIKAGICNESGDLLHIIEGPTEAQQGTDRILANIRKYVRQAAEEASVPWDQIAGVGVGVAGFLDIPRGFVKTSPNLPLANVPLKDHLEGALGKPVRVNNDANVAALAEARVGAGRNVGSIVMYTLGTGVGGGIVVDGRLIAGSSGMGGELGHMPIVPDLEAIQCGCGKMGCLETVSSATGIVRMAKDALRRGDQTVLATLETLTAADVMEAAKSGDATAQRIISRAAHYLGKSMAVVSVVVNPARFVIGGGVGKAGEFLLSQVREYFRKYALEKAQEGVEIVAAELGNTAGVIGAAMLLQDA